MENAAVARIFSDIADLLELKGENTFKIRAYQRAARTIEYAPASLERLRREGRLRSLPGIGEAVEKKVAELLDTGRLEYYEQLKAELPAGITALLGVPGIGPKTASRLAKELGVASVDDLEAAILSGRVAQVERLGEKTAQNILRHLQGIRRKGGRVPLGEAMPTAEEIVAALGDCPGLRNLTPAGSLRRWCETVGDIDMIGTVGTRVVGAGRRGEGTKAKETGTAEEVMGRFVALPQVREVLAHGATKSSVVLESGLQVDLRIVPHEHFGSLLQHFTGSKDHNVALRERAVRHGWSISEYGLTDVARGVQEHFAEEEAFYRRLGLDYIPPELRENQGEIDRAERGELPRLVTEADLKGDLHTHTRWSDGQATVEVMAAGAKALGLEYIAITDHSAGLGMVGLTPERYRQQRAEIQAVQERVGIRVLQGAEVNILADGSLDLPDDLLGELDFVVASVHTALEQEPSRLTERVIRAMRHPRVHALGHPSGRLLGKREPMDLDWEAVFRAAVETRTALEINAGPSRLDLRDVHIRQAREMGARFVLSTDAHRPEHLKAFRPFGVGTARRGWCEAEHVLNTRPWDEVKGYYEGKRQKAK
ncbi:MAG: DNA polymerase/3'-5' exonuclease PolX [Chloroflexi bacterium]|nr:DNA polymerase/3'-5' exonuclease PolX [Chloroflexota bacterium]